MSDFLLTKGFGVLSVYKGPQRNIAVVYWKISGIFDKSYNYKTKPNKMKSTHKGFSSQDINNILGQLTNPNKEIDQTGRFTVQCIVEIVSEHGIEDYEYPNDGYFKFKTIKEAYNFKYPKKYKDCYKQITEYCHDDETYGDAGDYTYWNHDLGSTYFDNLDGTEKNLKEYYHNEY